jgi:hypothetical protein
MVSCPQIQHPKPITQICTCSAKDIFKLPNQHAEVLIIDNIVEIQMQSCGSQARSRGADSDSFKVTDVLENTEGGILRCKGEERSLSEQTLVLDFLVKLEIHSMPLEPLNTGRNFDRVLTVHRR